MEPISGLMSGTLGLVCGGLCCVFAAILIVVAAIGLLRRKKAAPAPAPAASAPAATPAPTPAPAPAPAPAALPPPLPPTAASAHMDMPDEVEEFEDDDLPTTLMAPGGGPPEGMAPPPVPAPAPAAPPPVPVQRSIPRSAASSRLDVDQMPDIPTLRPGATIIPPDDWNDDYIDEADADETMLMPRPNLGLKKDD